MIPLKVTLHNSAKQKIAKFSISSEESHFVLDKQAVRAITQICVATLEMAQNNMLFDLSELSKETQTYIAGILAQQMEEAVHKKALFTANTLPKIILQPKEIKNDNNHAEDTNAELFPSTAKLKGRSVGLR